MAYTQNNEKMTMKSISSIQALKRREGKSIFIYCVYLLLHVFFLHDSENDDEK